MSLSQSPLESLQVLVNDGMRAQRRFIEAQIQWLLKHVDGQDDET